MKPNPIFFVGRGNLQKGPGAKMSIAPGTVGFLTTKTPIRRMTRNRLLSITSRPSLCPYSPAHSLTCPIRSSLFLLHNFFLIFKSMGTSSATMPASRSFDRHYRPVVQYQYSSASLLWIRSKVCLYLLYFNISCQTGAAYNTVE